MKTIRFRGQLYQAATMPQAGDVATSYDYDGQPYLYHWTPEDRLSDVLEQGLLPGRGDNWDCPDTKQHCSGRVFFSTDPDKWASFGYVLLRVPTDEVSCVYDGGEWVDQPEDEYIDGRLSDCYSEVAIPPELIEVVE